MMPQALEAKLLMLAFALLVAACLGFAGGLKLDAYKIERLKAANATQAARDNAIALAQLEAHDAAANKVVAELQQRLAERHTRTKIIRKVIHDAPKTHECVSSPAIRGLFDSMRSANGSD